MKILYILLTALLTMSLSPQDTNFFSAANAVFSASVKDGKVAYGTLKKNPEKLDQALKLAQSFKPDINEPEIYKAFWINAYNLSVFKQVVDNYPLASPQDVKGFFDKTTFKLGGKDITLNDIENKMLRAKFPEEARFHFVLVCAGLGCPPIINAAYRPKTLNDQMQQQTKLSLNNPDFIKVNGDHVAVSQIFKWYKEDFDKQGGTIAFINKFREDKLSQNPSVSYYDYDWKLNKTN